MNDAVLKIQEPEPHSVNPAVADLIAASYQVGPRYIADPMKMLTLPAIYEKKLGRLFPEYPGNPRKSAVASSVRYTATVILTELAHDADPEELEHFIDYLCHAQQSAFDALEATNKERSEL